MKVSELQKKLADAPPDMEVMILMSQEGIFRFESACIEESDIIILGPPPKIVGGIIMDEVDEKDENTGKEIFCISPHFHDHPEENLN